MTHPTCACSSKKASLSLISSDWSWVCCWTWVCLWLKNLTAATNSTGKRNNSLDQRRLNQRGGECAGSRSHRLFRSGASERPRGETAATSSSSRGTVRPAAPAAESAPRPWNRKGTSQRGTATPSLARRETRRLVHHRESTSVKPKKAFKQEP